MSVKEMKYTKNCTLPWTYMLVHAGGLIQTCPCASDIEIGDFIIDAYETHKIGKEKDIFNSGGLQRVRKGLLTGNLRKMCRDCAFCSPQLIPVEELQKKVIKLIEERDSKPRFLDIDELSKAYAYEHIGLSLSNKCNLRCIYCNQSTCADTNPFYRAEFPKECAVYALELFAKVGIRMLTCSVEGEATIYPYWYDVFHEFHLKYPDISLLLTTNLNKEYTEEEIELLVDHSVLDVSCDTLDEDLYSRIRVNGRLPLVLRNLQRVKDKMSQLGISKKLITIHVVVCDLTWETLEGISEYAFSNGFGLNIGNYEERTNAIGYRDGLLKTVYTLPEETQIKIAGILQRIKIRADELNAPLVMHGDIIRRIQSNIEHNYNKFVPIKEDIFCYSFWMHQPNGYEEMHLDIVYDHDNIAHTGILFHKLVTIEVNGLNEFSRATIKEVSIYKSGKCSTKYGQKIQPGYMKTYNINNGTLTIEPHFSSNDIESVLIEMIKLY